MKIIHEIIGYAQYPFCDQTYGIFKREGEVPSKPVSFQTTRLQHRVTGEELGREKKAFRPV